MTSPSTAPTLVERTEIHKSCKSVEILLNILNEYCDAAGAVVVLQKKLSKALKDAANTKVTGEIASNAMLASVNIFESLSDVNSKYSKIVDREYDTISSDVKKWFKKLTKEEKAHDERMANANAKIKQAGQLYEKKSKKKTSDANEEHARYINLISTLGPEISQEKYNHAVNISQRHTSTMYNVAACFARLADFEWQRSCECVKRFSPTIGPLGSFRSLCEGGWTRPIPPDLPDITASNVPTLQTEIYARLDPIEEDTRRSPRATPELTNPPERARVVMQSYPSGTFTDKGNSSDPVQDAQVDRDPQPVLPGASPNVSTNNIPDVPSATLSIDTLEPPKVIPVDPNTGSVRSLSAFPVPPTHFPIPPLHRPHRRQSTNSQSIQSFTSTPRLEFPSRRSPLAESPTSAHEGLSVESSEMSSRNGLIDSTITHSAAESAPGQFNYKRPTTFEAAELPQEQKLLDAINDREPQPFHQPQTPPHGSMPWNSRQTSPPALSSNSDIKPLKLIRDKESPTNRDYNNNPPSPTKSRTTGNYRYSRVERTDTGTSAGGSVVAAMRTRYDNNTDSTSPSPRNLPRLPISVNDMASRYQVEEVPLSPKRKSNSPVVSRQQSILPFEIVPQVESHRTNLDEERRRLQSQEELAENSRWQKEQELIERQQDLEMRARELERDRVRLQALREETELNSREMGYNRENNRGNDFKTGLGQSGIRPRERRISLRHQLQRPLSQMDLHESTESSESPVSPINQKLSTSRPLPQRSQQLHPPLAVDMPPLTPLQIHTPKPSHPPSPLLQNKDSLHESDSSNRYRDDASNSNTTSTDTFTSHAACCGCEKCSVSKYRSSESVTSQQPSGRKQKNSPVSKMGTGWIRRLSMPVGNAFGLDSKKHQNNHSIGSYALGSGLAGGHSAKGGGIFSLDSKKNVSTTALGVREDGELIRSGAAVHGRRSHEASGLGNRSMSNLGLR